MQDGTSSSTNRKAFLIAAPTSGLGKTTIARGLMALLTSKGYRVQPFKCGDNILIMEQDYVKPWGQTETNKDQFVRNTSQSGL